jgi:hypothetical protein
MGKFSACGTLLGTISPLYLKVPLYECVSNIFSSYEKVLLHNMDEGGEAAAEEELVAEQNDEVVVEATEEGQLQAHPRYTTATNTPTKRTLPWPMEALSSMTRH